ncbi:hypothetical protein [Halomonas ramblicola]|uniref:hypothetical protein n=1 Tax=Halomonas ramblicola TaxID=747349 RepID=UPI0025B49510|nr:hypothetical protein [Halomonas ramblicola]MDN3522552.1 hypothetical protein [Halomonas ramblicola]
MSRIKDTPQGIYHDLIVHGDGRYQDRGWCSNRVVNRCRILLAAFMRGDSRVAPGVQLMALGRGEPSWDTTPPESPAASAQALVDASPVTIAAADLDLAYLDATGESLGEASHRLQVSVTVIGGDLPIAGDGTFPLREFGLFGRFDGEDYMIDYVRHPVIHIGSGDTLVRRIRLVF